MIKSKTITACGLAAATMLALTPDARATMAARMREVVAGTSWDLTASSMHALIEGDAKALLEAFKFPFRN